MKKICTVGEDLEIYSRRELYITRDFSPAITFEEAVLEKNATQLTFSTNPGTSILQREGCSNVFVFDNERYIFFPHNSNYLASLFEISTDSLNEIKVTQAPAALSTFWDGAVWQKYNKINLITIPSIDTNSKEFITLSWDVETGEKVTRLRADVKGSTSTFAASGLYNTISIRTNKGEIAVYLDRNNQWKSWDIRKLSQDFIAENLKSDPDLVFDTTTDIKHDLEFNQETLYKEFKVSHKGGLYSDTVITITNQAGKLSCKNTGKAYNFICENFNKINQ